MKGSGPRYYPLFGTRRNVGAYRQPFSGVGMEFEPLGAPPADVGFTLHETGYWAHCRAWNFPNVYSPFWRIYYDFERCHYVQFGRRRTRLGPDRVLVIPNHQRFDCIGDPPAPKLWFAFSCRRNADPSQTMPIVIPGNPTICAFAAEFAPLFGSRTRPRKRIYQLSVAFISYVLCQPQISWQKSLPEPIGEVIAQINANPAAPWDGQTMAKLAQMSVDGFSRSFRRWMHATPARYVQEVRVREACQLLATSDQSIKKVAADLGFANRHHFSRVFRELTGTPPASYRRQHRRSDESGLV